MEGGGLCVLVDQDSINETEAPTCFQCQWHSSGMVSVYMPPRQRGPILGEDGRNGRRRKQAGESSVEIHEKEHPNVSTDRKHNCSQSDKLRKVMLGHFIQISLPLPHVLPPHSLVFLLAATSSTEAAVCQHDPSSILR